MALSVTLQSTFFAGTGDLIATKAPTAGDWLIAIAAVRVTDGSNPALYVGDVSRDIWQLVYSGTTVAHSTHAGAQMYVEAWACPMVRYDGWIDILRVTGATMAITASDVGSAVWNVFTVSGFVNGHLTVDSVTLNTASAANSFSVSSPAPSGGANCFQVGVVCVDDDTATITATGTGFTALTQVSQTTPGLKLSGQWKAATTGQTGSWTSSGAVNWAGLIVAIRETGVGPVAPSANWPIPKLEIGLGYDMSTPLSAVTWTDQTTRLVDTEGTVVLSAPRGIPYELGEAQSETAALTIRNDDGAYTPRAINTSAAANANGTTSTIKIADANATNIHAADFFQLKTAAGVLKETTVFINTAVASAGGTTTVTFARADGTGVAAASTVTGDVYAGLAVDVYIPWRYSMYWNGKWWPVASGWFGQLPQTWTDAWWGKVPAAGVDALATLTAANPSALAGEILRRSPIAYWPLSDSSGAGQAQDASGNNAPALVQKSSKFGTGANGAADFGQATQSVDNGITGMFNQTTLVGDSGTAWAQTGFTAAELNTNQGFALVGSGLNIDITAGITILGFSFMNVADINLIGGTGTNFDQTLMIVRNADPAAGVGQGSVLKVSAGHTIGTDAQDPKVTVWDKDTHAQTTTLCSGGNMVSSDFQMWAITFDPGTWSFDNSGVVTTGSCDLVSSIDIIDVGGESDRFFTGRFANAMHCHIAIFDRKLSTNEIAQIRFAGTQGTPISETLSGRVVRKLNTTAWRGPRVVHDSDLTPAAEGDDSGTMAELIQSLSGYEDGLFFLDALGQLQWRGHVPGYYQQSRATLGERTDLGEIPYQTGGTYAYDTTYIYNDIQVTNSQVNAFTGLSTALTVAADTASASKYGKRTLPRSVRLNKTADAYGLAWGLVARYKQPELRVGQVVVDCASYPAAWEFCLGAEIGDLITVNRRPLNAPMISQLCRILRVTPDIGPDIANFTFELGVADDPVIVLGGGTRAVIGNGTIGW